MFDAGQPVPFLALDAWSMLLTAKEEQTCTAPMYRCTAMFMSVLGVCLCTIKTCNHMNITVIHTVHYVGKDEIQMIMTKHCSM